MAAGSQNKSLSMERKTKWGVIYCPKEGSARTHKRWKKICAYMQEQGIQFDFVQSEGAGSVERLAGMLTENGYATIVIVGGDAALNHALNGIMHAQRPGGRLPVLGVVPNGFGNDFAKYWKLEADDYKKTVDSLMRRRTRKIDVGTADVETAGGRETYYFLNGLNVGLTASVVNVRRKARGLRGWLNAAYLYAVARVLLHRMDFKMDFRLNADRRRQRYVAFCAGSSRSYGLTPSAVPYNGQLDITAVAYPQIKQLFVGLWLLFTGRFLRCRDIRIWRTQHVSFSNPEHAPVSLDGRVLRTKVESMEIGIQPECLEFMIP